MRSQCIIAALAAPARADDGTLFSDWQATTHAEQPVQASRSIDRPQVWAPSEALAPEIGELFVLVSRGGSVLRDPSREVERERLDDVAAFHREVGLGGGEAGATAGLRHA